MTDLTVTPCSPHDCPIGSKWHEHWRAYTLHLAKQRDWPGWRTGVDGPILPTVPLDWTTGPGDARLFANRRVPPLTAAQHLHAAFNIEGITVHVDHVRASGGGPGFWLNALLFHIDGEFRGSAWVFGCLGADTPAVRTSIRLLERSSSPRSMRSCLCPSW